MTNKCWQYDYRRCSTDQENPVKELLKLVMWSWTVTQYNQEKESRCRLAHTDVEKVPWKNEVYYLKGTWCAPMNIEHVGLNRKASRMAPTTIRTWHWSRSQGQRQASISYRVTPLSKGLNRRSSAEELCTSAKDTWDADRRKEQIGRKNLALYPPKRWTDRMDTVKPALSDVFKVSDGTEKGPL